MMSYKVHRCVHTTLPLVVIHQSCTLSGFQGNNLSRTQDNMLHSWCYWVGTSDDGQTTTTTTTTKSHHTQTHRHPHTQWTQMIIQWKTCCISTPETLVFSIGLLSLHTGPKHSKQRPPSVWGEQEGGEERDEVQSYPDHPERFNGLNQVLCREGVSVWYCWVVELSGWVGISSLIWKQQERTGWWVSVWMEWSVLEAVPLQILLLFQTQ